MPWISIVLTDLHDARVAELIEALRQEALGSGQSDPMPRILQCVVDEMRRCIAFCASTPLDADDTTIPAGLKGLAVNKVVREMKARLLLPQTAEEADAEGLYQRRLEQLTRGEWPVDIPTNSPAASPVAAVTGVELASGSPRLVSRTTLGGL